MGHEFAHNPIPESAPRRLDIEVALMPQRFIRPQKEISEEQTGREKNVVRSAEELSNYFIPKREKDDENRNQRAALEALINESEIQLDTIEVLIKIDTVSKQELHKTIAVIANKYLEAWRSTGNDKQKRLESIRLEFANFIRSKLA